MLTTSRFMQLNTVLLALVIAATTSFVNSPCSAQDATPQEKLAVRKIKTNIDRAGKQYKAEKLESSGKYINAATKQVADLTVGARAELLELIQPEYDRLQKAHQLLTNAGQKLDELAALPAPMTGENQPVSFTKQVAPIIVAKCGNCHVNRNRGDFSAATFAALDGSAMIAYGIPNDSRMIEVIEAGEMPKGGLKIEEAELAILKLWIQQGAKFDGDNPQQNLTQFVSADQPDQPKAMEVAKPTGKETVSFGLHVAPILVENCAQCHIDSNNPRGNLNMAMFQTLLAGGDSGSPIVAGKSRDSMLFKRIDAGEMPPTGKLDQKLIDIVGKWIDEGAKFDGPEPTLNIKIVAAKSIADSQTHDELTASRQALAMKTWALVMSDVNSISVSTDNFNITGSTDQDRLEEVGKLIEHAVPKIKSAFRSDSSSPLIKGNVSVFVFDKRYDFSEFGKMVEQRDFPKEISGHWGYTTIDAYATVVMSRNKAPEDVEVTLTQQIGSIHIAGMAPDVPRWFADGMGYWAAKKIHGRDDGVKQWDAQAQQAAASMKQPNDFIMNRMPSDQAALVSYLFVKMLKSDGSRFGKLMKEIESGQTFEKSFMSAWGRKPEAMFGDLGGDGERQRRR